MFCPQLPRRLDPGLTDPPLLALPLLNVSLHSTPMSEAPPAASSSMNLGGGNGGGGGESALEFGIAIGCCALEKGFVLDRVAERPGP